MTLEQDLVQLMDIIKHDTSDGPVDMIISEATARRMGLACEVHPSFIPAGIDLDNGWELLNCSACFTTRVRPLTWASPHPEDYEPGHPLNSWGAYV